MCRKIRPVNRLKNENSKNQEKKPKNPRPERNIKGDGMEKPEIGPYSPSSDVSATP